MELLQAAIIRVKHWNGSILFDIFLVNLRHWGPWIPLNACFHDVKHWQDTTSKLQRQLHLLSSLFIYVYWR